MVLVDTVTLTIEERDGSALAGTYDDVSTANRVAYLWAQSHDTQSWSITTNGHTIRILPFRKRIAPPGAGEH
jgi:hypothetical protein